MLYIDIDIDIGVNTPIIFNSVSSPKLLSAPLGEEFAFFLFLFFFY